MRFRDLIEASYTKIDDLDNSIAEDSSQIDNTVLTVLSQIHTTITLKKLNANVKLSTILDFITKTTKLNYTKEDLLALKDRNKTVANMIKNVDDEKVEFSTDENQIDTSDNGDTEEIVDLDQTDIPQNTVSNMAKSAMRKRQD
jgi:hypothetical protein